MRQRKRKNGMPLAIELPLKGTGQLSSQMGAGMKKKKKDFCMS